MVPTCIASSGSQDKVRFTHWGIPICTDASTGRIFSGGEGFADTADLPAIIASSREHGPQADG